MYMECLCYAIVALTTYTKQLHSLGLIGGQLCLSPFLNLISIYHINLFQKVNITIHLIHLSNELYTISIFTH